jgi:Glycosyltransferase family 87
MSLQATAPPATTTLLGRVSVPRRTLGLAVISVGLIVLALLFVRALAAPVVDFLAYYDGGLAFRQGQPLYERALKWRAQGWAPLYPVEGLIDFPFVYPPAFALSFVPLTLLPTAGASVVWLTGLLACLLGTGYALSRLLVPAGSRARLPVAIALSAVMGFFQPLRSIFVTGQADCLVLLLLVLVLLAFTDRRDGLTGLLLGVAVAIKPTVGLLLLFLLWKRAYRSAIVFCATAAVLLLVPFIFAGGVGGVLDYANVSLYWSGPQFGVSPVNQSPYGMLLRLFTPNAYTVPILVAPMVSTILRYAIVGATLLVLARSVRRTRDLPLSLQALEFGLVVVGLLVASPLSEAGNYGYLVIPLVAIGAAVAQVNPGRRRDALVIGGLAAVIYAYLCIPSLTPMDMAFFAYWQAPVGGPRLLLTGMHLYGLVALAAVTATTLVWWRRVLHPTGVRADGQAVND